MTPRLSNPFRHQLPAHSPVPARGVAGAFGAALAGDGDPDDALREVLAERYGAGRVALLGSGTQALTLALRRAARRTGGQVALPAYSCFDVGAAAVALGRRVRFYDLDPRTLGPDPASLRAALRAGARIVVVAPLFGIPVDWGPLDEVFAEEEAIVVEDAAQGHGAGWRGDPVGARGPYSVLSFGRGKGWTGGGAGGALLLRGGASAEVLSAPKPEGTGRRGAALRVAVTSAALWALSRPAVYRIPRSLPLLGLGETHYRPPRPIAPIPPGASAFLLATRDAADAEAERRRAHAAEYRALLADRAGDGAAAVPDAGQAGYLRFPLRLPGGMAAFADPNRGRLLGAAPGYPRALPSLEALAGLLAPGEDAKRWPGAEELVRTLVTLPTHSRTRASERRELVASIDRG